MALLYHDVDIIEVNIFLDALASLKTMFKIKQFINVFKTTRFQEYYRVLQSIAEYYRVLQSITE